MRDCIPRPTHPFFRCMRCMTVASNDSHSKSSQKQTDKQNDDRNKPYWATMQNKFHDHCPTGVDWKIIELKYSFTENIACLVRDIACIKPTIENTGPAFAVGMQASCPRP